MARKSAVIERSTFGVEVDFQEDGVSILISAVTACEWERRAIRTGDIAINGSGVPATNPAVIKVDLKASTETHLKHGDRLEFHTKFTYNSTKLGTGAVGRGRPLLLVFKPSPMVN